MNTKTKYNLTLVGLLIALLFGGWAIIRYQHPQISQSECYRLERFTIADDKVVRQCVAQYAGSESRRDIMASSKFGAAWVEHEMDSRTAPYIVLSTIRYDQDEGQCYAMVSFEWTPPTKDELLSLLFAIIPHSENLTCNITTMASP